MNAIDLLKEDHDVVDALFKRVEDTPPSKHPPIFKKIKNELDTHAHIEEKVFYPALKAKGNKELVDITAEGFEEHSQIKKFLKEIARSTSTEKREAKLKVLMEDTRHHVKEEEDEMFPMVKDQFSSDVLNALGEKMEAEKKKFQKAKKIPARRTQPPKGVVAAILDKATELVAGAFGGGPQSATYPKAKKTGGRKSSSAAKTGGRAAATSKAGSNRSSNGKGTKQTTKSTASSSRSTTASKAKGRSSASARSSTK